MTPDEAKRITGYGDDKKGRRSGLGSDAALLSFEFDPNRTWGKKMTPEEIERHTGKRPHGVPELLEERK